MISQPHPNAPYVSTFSAPSIDQVAAADRQDHEVQVARGRASRSASISGEGTTLTTSRTTARTAPTRPNTTRQGVQPPVRRRTSRRRHVRDAGRRRHAGAAQERARRRAGGHRRRCKRAGRARRTRCASTQHLENIRAHREPADATTPTLPPGRAPACKSRASRPPSPTSERRSWSRSATKAMSDLIAMALACDQTRVFSMMFSGSGRYTVFWQVGVDRGPPRAHARRGGRPAAGAGDARSSR